MNEAEVKNIIQCLEKASDQSEHFYQISDTQLDRIIEAMKWLLEERSGETIKGF